MHYTTRCNTQSSAPEDGQNNFPKPVELTGIINKSLLLHLVGCLYYLYQRCRVKQISDNEIYLLIKYIKSVLWRVAKCLSYIEEARCLRVKRFSSYRAVNGLPHTCTREVPSSNLEWSIDNPDAHLSALPLVRQVQKGTVLAIRPIPFPITSFLINY